MLANEKENDPSLHNSPPRASTKRQHRKPVQSPSKLKRTRIEPNYEILLKQYLSSLVEDPHRKIVTGKEVKKIRALEESSKPAKPQKLLTVRFSAASQQFLEIAPEEVRASIFEKVWVMIQQHLLSFPLAYFFSQDYRAKNIYESAIWAVDFCVQKYGEENAKKESYASLAEFLAIFTVSSKSRDTKLTRADIQYYLSHRNQTRDQTGSQFSPLLYICCYPKLFKNTHELFHSIVFLVEAENCDLNAKTELGIDINMLIHSHWPKAGISKNQIAQMTRFLRLKGMTPSTEEDDSLLFNAIVKNQKQLFSYLLPVTPLSDVMLWTPCIINTIISANQKGDVHLLKLLAHYYLVLREDDVLEDDLSEQTDAFEQLKEVADDLFHNTYALVVILALIKRIIEVGTLNETMVDLINTLSLHALFKPQLGGKTDTHSLMATKILILLHLAPDEIGGTLGRVFNNEDLKPIKDLLLDIAEGNSWLPDALCTEKVVKMIKQASEASVNETSGKAFTQ